MRKLYTGAVFMCLSLSIPAQEVVWRRDIKSSTQDFLARLPLPLTVSTWFREVRSNQNDFLRQPNKTAVTIFNMPYKIHKNCLFSKDHCLKIPLISDSWVGYNFDISFYYRSRTSNYIWRILNVTFPNYYGWSFLTYQVS